MKSCRNTWKYKIQVNCIQLVFITQTFKSEARNQQPKYVSQAAQTTISSRLCNVSIDSVDGVLQVINAVLMPLPTL